MKVLKQLTLATLYCCVFLVIYWSLLALLAVMSFFLPFLMSLETIFGAAVVAIGATFYVAWRRERILTSIYLLLTKERNPGFDWIKDTNEWFQAARIIFVPALLNRYRSRFQPALDNLPDRLLATPPTRFLCNREVLGVILKFIGSEPALISSLIAGKNEGGEAYNAFKNLLESRVGISEAGMVLGIIYVAMELNYSLLTDVVSQRSPSDGISLIREVVKYDISNEFQTADEEIRRYAKDHMVSLPKFKSIRSTYSQERDALKHKSFEASLHSSLSLTQASLERHLRRMTLEEFFKEALDHNLDIRTDSYEIVGPDFSRDSKVDRVYRQAFQFTLAAAFNNRCCKCKEGIQQLELDHFWFPKMEGGNFAMKLKTGSFVNNCIPLCRSCNASKGARSFLDFFEQQEVEQIVTISQSLNSRLNASMIDVEDARS